MMDNYGFISKNIEAAKDSFQIECCSRMVELFKEKYPAEVAKWLMHQLENKREEIKKPAAQTTG